MSGESVPWDVADERARRFEFVTAVLGGGDTFAGWCRSFGISRKTGYKWMGRYEAEGWLGLADRSRRPRSSPERTPVWVEEAVCAVKDDHPAWGGRKIHHFMVRRGDEVVPAPSTITGILRRHGLLDDSSPVSRDFLSFEADAPNDLWQMDHKGWFMTGEGRCDPFDVMDDHSRFNLCLDARGKQDEHTTKQQLSGVFTRYGLPKSILCDNGPPWGNTQDGFRWAGLGVWLLDLGVNLIHSAVYHPQTIGKDERFHRTLGLEVISTRDHWDSYDQVQDAFDEWRSVYNYQRPHDSLNGGVPGDRYQPSQRNMPTSIEPPQYPDEYLTRKVSTEAQITIHNRRVRIGRAFAGRQVGLAPTSRDGVYHVYYRTAHIRTIHLT